MREVKYTDSLGQNFVVRIPDDAPLEHAKWGVRVGPPELDGLGLPLELQVRLHNELWARGLLTYGDIRQRRGEVASALREALKLGVGQLEGVYWNAR
jgi:hypothetical protein